MKKLVLATLIFCIVITFAIPASAQVVIQFPAPPSITIGLPVIRVYLAPPPEPYYVMSPAPYPDRYNSYRTGSYEDYYLPPGMYYHHRHYSYHQ